MTPKRKRSAESRRCALYVRISKDRANEVSTDVQREATAKYAKDRGWQVVDVFEDVGRSAFKANVRRPGFEAMMEALSDGTVDTLIAYKLDRVSRSVVDFANLSRQLDEQGSEFVSVTEGFDTTTPMGRAMVQIASVFAELESAVKSERISDALAHLRASGSPTNGPRPYGFAATKGTDGKPHCDRQTIDKREAKVIASVARQVIAGAALREIVADLNKRGIPNSRGAVWNRVGLARMLKNPTTAGLSVVDGSLVTGTMPAALDRATWEQVREVLTDPTRRTGTSNGVIHLLSGIIVCGRCGAPLTAKPHREGSRYTCGPRKGHEDACGGVSIAVATADNLVFKGVVAACSGPAMQAATRSTGKRGRNDAAQIDDDLEALATEFGAGNLSQREWLAARAALEERRERLADDQRLGRTSAAYARLANAKNIGKAWAALDVPTQRSILTRNIVERIAVDGADAPATLQRRDERLADDPDSLQRVIPEDRIDVTWRS